MRDCSFTGERAEHKRTSFEIGFMIESVGESKAKRSPRGSDRPARARRRRADPGPPGARSAGADEDTRPVPSSPCDAAAPRSPHTHQPPDRSPRILSVSRPLRVISLRIGSQLGGRRPQRRDRPLGLGPVRSGRDTRLVAGRVDKVRTEPFEDAFGRLFAARERRVAFEQRSDERT